ncbi:MULTISPECIES: hypothetical protein [Pelotomaculum]|nr:MULTISPECIES: hypothetical protein [Pelotomaculum]OPX86961.1 MAG: hypothetical protein A4E54_01886 [Pelotomaculum sp. PtaB.Bin117]OPY61552.1 MAG: hypothetical protein A4E56_01970 [Pelotomaculum sp. PtaU1.Bin065]
MSKGQLYPSEPLKTWGLAKQAREDSSIISLIISIAYFPTL